MMKSNVYWALGVILAGVAAPVSSKATEPADTKISEVTVYADRARITRTATFHVPAGSSSVEIGGLTNRLDDRTIEVSGQSSGQVTIRGVDVRQEFLAGNASPRAAEVQRQLDSLLDQRRELEGQNGILKARQSFFENVTAGLSHSEKGVPDADELKKLYDFYLGGLTEVSTALFEVQGKQRALDLEINRTKQELSALSQEKATRKVAISLDAAAAADLTITLRYTVPDASWEPIYDARVNTSDGSVLLAYNAYIRQKTGEEWNNVKLSVSTARPGLNGQLPELNPDYLSFVVPPASVAETESDQLRAFKAQPEAKPGGAPVPREEVPQQTATLQTVGLAVTYMAPEQVDIPSDGQPHQTSLSQLKLTGQLAYVCAPKLELAVFVKTHLTNNSPDTLLAGNVHVFRDGDLIGDATIPEIVTGAEFDLFCGRDDSVKIERKELVNRQAQTGFFNRRRQTERKFQITLQNHRKAPVKVSVYDQIPVSQDSQITVQAGQMSPQPTDLDKDTGKLTWTFSLNPTEKKVIEFDYTVEWPADKQISL